MDRISKLRQFLESQPGDAFLKHALALELIKLGDEPGARKEFEEILHAQPDYVGSYYHLAKLLERVGEPDSAILWYEKGMEAAKRQSDQHAFNELRAAYEELTL